MEILLGKNIGFCYGVKIAIQKTKEELKENKELYCLGKIVHNKQVLSNLENLGLKVIEKIEDSNNKVIIRSHGIPKEIYQKAQKLNIDVLDFTCPIVLNMHKMVEEYAIMGYYIFLIGIKSHPENIGTISFCGKNSCLIETKEEIDEAIESFKKSTLKKLLIVAQTTFSLEKFNNYLEQIKKKIDKDIELNIKNTICNETKVRQKETYELSKKVQYMIVIGGKHSSNTQKLYEIAKRTCQNAIMIETKDELDVKSIKKFEKIGIISGASTPEETVEEIVKILES